MRVLTITAISLWMLGSWQESVLRRAELSRWFAEAEHQFWSDRNTAIQYELPTYREE